MTIPNQSISSINPLIAANASDPVLQAAALSMIRRDEYTTPGNVNSMGSLKKMSPKLWKQMMEGIAERYIPGHFHEDDEEAE